MTKSNIFKRACSIAVMAVSLCALMSTAAADKYVFSGDGETVGSSPRELPTQGVELATGRVVVGLHALTDAERGACGWYRILPGVKPEAHSNEVWRVYDYVLDAGLATTQYKCTWRKVKPRTFSKLKCVAALIEAGVWNDVKSYIEQAGLYDLYLAAQDFSEDNDFFVRGKAQLQSALGWSDEQVEAVLKASEVK